MYLPTEEFLTVKKKILENFTKDQGWLIIVEGYFNTLSVTILEAPYKFINDKYEFVSIFYLEKYKHKEVLEEIVKISKSDLWILDLSLGTKTIPFKYTKGHKSNFNQVEANQSN